MMKRLNYYGTRFRTPLAAAVLLTALSVAAPAQIVLNLNRVESFTPHFAAKKKMNAAYRPALEEILPKLHKRMEAGESLHCSSQIYEELHWLVNYTDQKDEIESRMADLSKSLEQKDQSAAGKQDPKDGSFAPCMDAWLWRFFRSVDPLKELAQSGEKPSVPLKIWDPVDTPEELTALMRKLQVSDLSAGHNKRKELNLAVTALGQLLWLDYTASVFPEHLDREALGAALWNFVDKEWQDPDTGYWGAWYKDGDTVHKTQDLSMTFHIMSYRDGKVSHRGKIGKTTAAVRDVKYPYGWDTGGTQNNHHAYDVARIINLTWDELDLPARARAGADLFLLMSRSLAMSVDSHGHFDPGPYTTVGEAYYFGISFFDEMGLFGNEVPRTNAVEIRQTEDLYDQIDANLDKLDQTDPWVTAARRKLEGIRK